MKNENVMQNFLIDPNGIQRVDDGFRVSSRSIVLMVAIPRPKDETKKIFIPNVTGSAMEISWSTIEKMGLKEDFEM